MQPGILAAKLPAIGDIFGRWTVIALPKVERLRRSKDRWTCRCSCELATIREVRGDKLIYGMSKSCGCLLRDTQRERNERFALRHTAKVSWRTMLRRADANVAEAWRASFEQFFLAMGPRPIGTVLSRKDLEGPYDATNCFWEDRREQVERVRALRWSTPNAHGWASGPMKHCSKCREEKPVSAFYFNNASKTKLHASCKDCCNDVKRRDYVNKAPNRILQSAKNRAWEKRLEFSLTVQDLLPLPTRCPVFDIELTHGKEGKGRGAVCDSAFSIDRRDNSKGYTPDNVTVVSWLANRLKSNAEAWQLERVAAWMRGRDLVRETVGVSEGFLF